jgi:Na+/proline symporter
MIRGAVRRWWSMPRTRLRIARVMVVAGFALIVLAFATSRWGLVFAGILLIGFGAAAGPARIRRERDRSDREEAPR